MIFITEFEVSKERQHPILFVDFRGEKQAEELGRRILDVFDWVKDSNDIVDRYKLEIEAFPMDKWNEFKHKLTGAVNYDMGLMKKVVYAITELESFGKPAGAAKQQDNG